MPDFQRASAGSLPHEVQGAKPAAPQQRNRLGAGQLALPDSPLPRATHSGKLSSSDLSLTSTETRAFQVASRYRATTPRAKFSACSREGKRALPEPPPK